MAVPSARCLRKVFFWLTGPYLTRRATIGRLEPPLGRGRFVGPPYEKPPHKSNGQYGPGFIRLMTPGDTLPPPSASRPRTPLFRIGDVREVVDAFHGPPPDGGASRRRATVSWWSSSPHLTDP